MATDTSGVMTGTEWAQQNGRRRWEGVSKKDRIAHAKKMVRARLKKARARKRKATVSD